MVRLADLLQNTINFPHAGSSFLNGSPLFTRCAKQKLKYPHASLLWYTHHMIDWTIIKTEYENTDQSIRTLAEKYGASKSAISKKSRAEHWTRPTRPLSTLSTADIPLSLEPLDVLDKSLATQARISRELLASQLSYGFLISMKEHKQYADILLIHARIEEILARINPPPTTLARTGDEIDYTQLADHELKEMQELMMKARILTD